MTQSTLLRHLGENYISMHIATLKILTSFPTYVQKGRLVGATR
jgi:hypothetical protein